MSTGDVAVGILRRIAAEPVTRSVLAKETGLAPSTVSAKITELMDAGLVQEGGAAPSRGGRPGRLLSISYTSGRIAVISMGAKHARLGLADFSRTILCSSAIDIDVADGPERTVELLANEVRALLERDGGDLLSVGICLPGPVDAVRRVVVAPSRMPGWHNQDVGALLEKQLGVPAITDNDANMAALGEYSPGPMPQPTPSRCSPEPAWAPASSPAGNCTADPPTPPGTSPTPRWKPPPTACAPAETADAWKPSPRAPPSCGT